MSFKDWFSQLSPGEQLNHYFRRCNLQHSRIVDRNLVQAEIYGAQHRVLAMLNFKPMMSQKEIAGAMEVSTATIAVTLKKMEKNGYVERIMDDEDNRFNKVRVTEKGRCLMEQGFDIMDRIDRDTIKGFTEEELKQFNGFLERYLANLNEMAETDYAGMVTEEKKKEK